MAYIDQANIACGGHAGDTLSMERTVRLAKAHDVSVGAHPSYPDKVNFGRVSLNIPPHTLLVELQDQVEKLSAICSNHNIELQYIKAHGALYNDSNHDTALFKILLTLAVKNKCALMIQSHPDLSGHKQLAETLGVKLILEGFADRAYENSGDLKARNEAHAVHSAADIIVQQALSFKNSGGVNSAQGKWLDLPIDSLCVHGDSPFALNAVKAIHDAFH